MTKGLGFGPSAGRFNTWAIMRGFGMGGSGIMIAPGLPQQSAIVARWRADSITPVADGTSIPSWTDSINGQVLANGTGAAQPTYLANGGYGGKPALLFNGSQYLFGAATQAMAAVSSGEVTMLVVYGNIQSTSFGFLFNATDSTGINICNDSTKAGMLSGPQQVPYTATGFSTGAIAASKTYVTGFSNMYQVYVNGSVINETPTVLPGTPSQIGIGASATGVGGAKARIMEALVWNRRLTLAEMLRAEKALRDYYAQPYPWTAQGYYYVALGDSITKGYGLSTVPFQWPYLLSVAQSMPMGSWSSLGMSSAAPLDIKNVAIAEGTTGISAITGVPTKYSYWEFYNDKSNSTTPYSSSVSLTRQTAVLTYLKATAGDKVAFGTTVDYTNRTAAKGYFTAYWDTPANRTGLMDAYVPLHLDATLGVDGACNNAAPYGPAFNNINATLAFTGSIASSQLVLGTASAVVVGSTLRWAGYTPSNPITIGAYQSGGSGAGTVGAIYALTGSPPATLTSRAMNSDSGDGVHLSDYGATLMPAKFAVVASM